MSGPFSQRRTRMDVIPILQSGAGFRWRSTFAIHALKASWFIDAEDYQTNRGLSYQVTAGPDGVQVRDGVDTFLELTMAAVPKSLGLELEVRRYGSNFLPTLALPHLRLRLSLPALFLPETTHLNIIAGLPTAGEVTLTQWDCQVTALNQGESFDSFGLR